MSRYSGRVALAGTLVAASASGGPALDVVGACPDPESVQRLLGELVPGGETPAPVSIQDRGEQYRVAVGPEATTLEDPGRDCAARARHTAVVVASGMRSHNQLFGPPEWTIEKGLVFDVASSGGTSVWAPGAEFRGAYGSRRWSIVGSAGARAATLTFQDAWKAELLRFPLDAGARLTWYRWRLRPWVTFGPSLTLTGFLGEELLEAKREWRFDPGVLGMAGATLPLFKRIGVAAAINVRWQPRTYHLQVDPLGTVGETPRWWLGLSLNYTVDGKPSSP